MSKTEVSIATLDGDARAYAFKPQGQGPWPAVIFYMDAPAIRPALFEMCERLAERGYYVLLPDMFWRVGPYEPINLAEALASEETRRAIFGKFMSSTNPEKSTRDTGAFLAWLDAQPEARTDRVGATGSCMGAGLALRAAGNYPDKVVATAGFHGGRLATDEPDSPHLLAPKIKAKVYIGGADEDAGFPPEQADRLRDALTAAGVDNRVEIYPSARHGYTMPDLPVYNEPAAERHWQELFALLDETLKQPA
jgi:carboxymethylenebutenolidase